METLRKHALNLAAFLWGVAEATLFFFVPDVILSYIGVRQGPRAAAKASLIAAIGAATGGVIMYLWSQADPAAARAAVEVVPAISAEMIARAQVAMSGDWFGATLFGPLTSTPYKVYAILAPSSGVPVWAFALASIIARLPRFLGVGIGVALIAAYLRRRKLPERTILGILAGCWVVFYLVFFALMPN
jgi:membrane protein YqaA with SNARE-associated domain